MKALLGGVIGLAMLFQLAFAQEDDLVVPGIRAQMERVLTGMGRCSFEGGVIDLDEVWMLENRRVRRDATTVLRMDDTRFYIERGNSATIIEPIFVVPSDTPLDIDIKFAVVNGEMAIYWRETFQHRSYRHGLLRIEENDLSPWCEGRGGVDFDH